MNDSYRLLAGFAGLFVFSVLLSNFAGVGLVSSPTGFVTWSSGSSYSVKSLLNDNLDYQPEGMRNLATNCIYSQLSHCLPISIPITDLNGGTIDAALGVKETQSVYLYSKTLHDAEKDYFRGTATGFYSVDFNKPLPYCSDVTKSTCPTGKKLHERNVKIFFLNGVWTITSSTVSNGKITSIKIKKGTTEKTISNGATLTGGWKVSIDSVLSGNTPAIKRIMLSGTPALIEKKSGSKISLVPDVPGFSFSFLGVVNSKGQVVTTETYGGYNKDYIAFGASLTKGSTYGSTTKLVLSLGTYGATEYPDKIRFKVSKGSSSVYSKHVYILLSTSGSYKLGNVYVDNVYRGNICTETMKIDLFTYSSGSAPVKVDCTAKKLSVGEQITPSNTAEVKYWTVNYDVASRKFSNLAYDNIPKPVDYNLMSYRGAFVSCWSTGKPYDPCPSSFGLGYPVDFLYGGYRLNKG